ncbi:MAG: hypothetical protein EBZ36_15950, partial [Acidobacteria bacterium]|nr:hypothetical protein [Acidobacteriota bacterium]
MDNLAEAHARQAANARAARAKAEGDAIALMKEMGLQGLVAVLDFLADEEGQALIERVYGKALPAFYLACPQQQTQAYLQRLLRHLKQGSYFPYTQLGFSYQAGDDDLFINSSAKKGRVK